jgi:hypothetical protein
MYIENVDELKLQNMRFTEEREARDRRRMTTRMRMVKTRLIMMEAKRKKEGRVKAFFPSIDQRRLQHRPPLNMKTRTRTRGNPEVVFWAALRYLIQI